MTNNFEERLIDRLDRLIDQVIYLKKTYAKAHKIKAVSQYND